MGVQSLRDIFRKPFEARLRFWQQWFARVNRTRPERALQHPRELVQRIVRRSRTAGLLVPVVGGDEYLATYHHEIRRLPERDGLGSVLKCDEDFFRSQRVVDFFAVCHRLYDDFTHRFHELR